MTDMTTTPPGDARLDLESLAAYLDGTLPADERDAMERLLASSRDAREVLVEAVRILGMEEGITEGATDSGADPAIRPIRRRWVVPALAAAAIATLSLLPILRSAGPDGFADVDRLLGASPALLSEGWDVHPWPVTRSFRQLPSPERSAFRAGVRWTDALVAWRGGRPAEAVGHLEAIATLVGQVAPDGGAALGALRDQVAAGSAPEEADAAAAEARSALDATFPPGIVALGTWSEAARLATRDGALDYLGAARTLRVLEEIHRGDLPPAAAEALDGLAERLRAGVGAEELPEFAEALNALMTLLGS